MTIIPHYKYERNSPNIYANSFYIISKETNINKFDNKEQDIVIRMIHACGIIEIVDNIEFGYDFSNIAYKAIINGAHILCDTEMVSLGIIRNRLSNNKVICTLNDHNVKYLSKSIINTRSAASIYLWKKKIYRSIVVIGNAPTALFHLLELINDGWAHPYAIIGTPVGFVGAIESKEALANNLFNIPYVIVRGRMGGSAIAASIINALSIKNL
ncbi:Precorrin-8X methylmutase [Candidatus Johnevansia muelleri]|uniref:Precorrin-8X methylmutase n=1 Tax=Candidatus Johnevansia muelleri TaxID=1495769 RepID=A0A078KHR4_9GAMM|nr:Precorrin-8X methylmutase [Candidatus Evansia muelleri]